MNKELLILKAIEFLKRCEKNADFEEANRIGCGCERIAYSLEENLVLKIRKDFFCPPEPEYWDERYDISEEFQTDREVEVWNKMSEEERALFNPILADGKYQGETFIIAPYVDTESYEIDCEEEATEVAERNGIKYDFELLQAVANKFCLDYLDMVSNFRNFGVNAEGRLVVTDFGLEEY